MPDQPLDQPQMTVLAKRPIKILYAPHSDILIACRTAAGEDVHVPASAILEMFATEIVKRVHTSGGQAHGHDR